MGKADSLSLASRHGQRRYDRSRCPINALSLIEEPALERCGVVEMGVAVCGGETSDVVGYLS